MQKSKEYVVLSLILMLSLFLTACSGDDEVTNNQNDTGGSTEEGGSEGQVLHLTAPGEVSSVDIHYGTSLLEQKVSSRIRAGLMRLNENGEIVPDMAADMPKISEDKTVYTFKIRDDAVWSDGEPVTAQDFVYSWQRLVNPKTAADDARIVVTSGVKNADKIMDKDSDMYGQVEKLGVKAIDEKTFEVTLEQATPYFTSLMVNKIFMPLRKDIVEKYGDKYATTKDKLLYNGPYVLAEWDHAAGWTYKKNPKYWNADQIKLDKVVMKVSAGDQTNINLFNAGKIDYAEVSSQHIPQFKNSDAFHTELTNIVYFFRVNSTKGPLANENIRDALYNAFDREALTNGLIKEGSSPAWYWVPKEFVKGPNGKEFREGHQEINKQSLEWAKEKWEKGLKELGKDDLTLTILSKDNEYNSKIAVFIQAQWEKNLPGLTVKVNKQPTGNFFDKVFAADYQFALTNRVPDFRDPLTYLSRATYKRYAYPNEEYDKLINQAVKLGNDPQKRWEIMHNAEKMLLEDAGIIPLFQLGSAYVLNPNVKNFVFRKFSTEGDWEYAHIE